MIKQRYNYVNFNRKNRGQITAILSPENPLITGLY